MENIITPEIEEKLIEWCKAEKYSQGDDYRVRLTCNGKYAVRYSNDYPMQHGAGKEFILSDKEFEYAMNRPLTEFELMGKFWYPKRGDERQELCDKYYPDEMARCLNQDKLIHIFKQENK